MWAVLFFLLFSPAHSEELKPLPIKELAEYLAVFTYESHGIIKLKDLTDSRYVFKRLEWESAKGGTIADCVSTLHMAPFTIEIDERYWNTVGHVDHLAIMFHELGHCACGLDHTVEKGAEWLADLLEEHGFKTAHARKFPDGCPDSIMHWRVPHKACMVTHQDEYMEELFLKCKRPIRFAVYSSW